MAPRIPRRDSSSIVRHSIKRTKEKERSMNFSRVVYAIFKGREAKIKVTSGLATFISFHVYILLTCTSGTQPWLTTDWKFISSLPPFYSSAFRFLFFLSLFLSFFLSPLLSSPRVRGSGWNRVLDSDSRDRSNRWNGSFVLTTLETRGGNNPNCRE